MNLPSCNHRYIFFWKMLLRDDKISNFNCSKVQNEKQIAFTTHLIVKLMSNHHVFDIFDNVYITQVFFMPHILMQTLFLTINTHYQQILKSFVDKQKCPYEPKKFQTKNYTYAKTMLIWWIYVKITQKKVLVIS